MKREENALSYDDWFHNPAISVTGNSGNLGWSCIFLQVANLHHTDSTQAGPILEDPVINMIVAGKGILKTNLRETGLSPLGNKYTIGHANLVPSGFQANGEWNGSFKVGFWRLFQKSIDELAAQTCLGDPKLIEIRPKFLFQDALLSQLLFSLVTELHDASFMSPLYADSLAHTIMLHLIKNYSNVTKIILPQKGCLSPSQKAILEDYIAANLAENIQITALAQLLHLSVSHLERLFRASYGVPIYRYVIQRRIERAKVLLASKEHRLCDVAAESGFSSQSHFNRHFKAQLGISPKRFRECY